MSVSVIGTFKGGSGASTGSVTVTTPAATQVGDLITVLFEMKQATTCAPIGPDGTWSLLGGQVYGNVTGGSIAVMSKVATVAGAQSFTFTFENSSTHVVVSSVVSAVTGYILRGQKSSGPLVALTAGGSGTTQAVTFPTVTPGEDAELIIRLCGGQVSSGSTDMKSPTWDAAVGNVVSAQGNNGTSTGLAWLTSSTEVGPTPAAAIGTRSLTLQAVPPAGGWARLSVGVLAAPTGAPSNTVAPAVTGTAAVGQVLSCDTGTWDQTGLTFTRQWQRDGSNISGATASTYTVVSGDAGHTIRCVVTATNTSSQSTSANSNGVAIPSAPVNTVAPHVTHDGTPATGETVSCDTGTWTGTGLSYTYQWYRGASPITGATSSTYTLQVTDEGASIRCDVTAHNGGGDVTASSNVIVPAITAPLSDASFLDYYSGGAGNTDPALSIGGARGGTYPGGLDALEGPIVGTVAQAGGVFYRVVYIRNTHTLSTAAACKLFIEQQFTSPGLEVAAAVPSQAANVTVPALASETTAPTGVTWTTASTPSGGLDFGDLGPGAFRGVYLRFTVAAGATPTSGDSWGIAIEGSAA